MKKLGKKGLKVCMENNVKTKKLPNRDYVRDHLYLKKYGRFDKSIMQSRTMESFVKFVIDGLSVGKKEVDKKGTEKWINDGYSLIRYWDKCTSLARKRRDLSRKESQRKGNNNENNTII